LVLVGAGPAASRGPVAEFSPAAAGADEQLVERVRQRIVADGRRHGPVGPGFAGDQLVAPGEHFVTHAWCARPRDAPGD